MPCLIFINMTINRTLQQRKKYCTLLMVFLVFEITFYFSHSFILILITYYRKYEYSSQKKDVHQLSPPFLDSSELPWNYNSQTGLEILSQAVQKQIKTLQDPESCRKNSILCGHFDDCGFACQIHHRAACLMISYAMGLPLIHDVESGFDWSYSTPWTDLMLPIGSPCPISQYTYNWTWYHPREFYSKPMNNSIFAWNLNKANETDGIAYPLYDGIVVSSPLADLVEKLHPDPAKWWTGQFIQHAMQLRPEIMDKIHTDQNEIGLRSDCIGFHIRRTDKVNEYSGSFHELHEYFEKAKHLTDFKNDKKPNVFIASDDSSILSSAIKNYTEWDVVGFYSNQTLHNPKERRKSLYDILRDIVTLSQCPTVICGLTSNVCRLIFELHMDQKDNLKSKLISIDGSYDYTLWGTSLKSHINKYYDD